MEWGNWVDELKGKGYDHLYLCSVLKVNIVRTTTGIRNTKRVQKKVLNFNASSFSDIFRLQA